MKYDLSAVEILRFLGYDKPVGKEALEAWMQEKGTSFPKVYCEFMELAMNCPMLETADLWVGRMGNFTMKPWFLYDEIEEEIEDQKKAWGKNSANYETSVYYSFSQIPREQWREKVEDYLEIGSDYGAGIVTFAIRREDLEQADPPVYLHHEADEMTEWRQMYEKLSDYLLEVVLNALHCEDYSTAADMLEERGYRYLDFDTYEMELEEEEELLDEEEWYGQMLSESGIDLSKVYKRMSNSGESELFCCYEEEKGFLYVGEISEEEVSLVVISKEE